MAFTDLEAGIVYLFDPTRPWGDQPAEALPAPDGSRWFAVAWSPDG